MEIQIVQIIKYIVIEASIMLVREQDDLLERESNAVACLDALKSNTDES